MSTAKAPGPDSRPGRLDQVVTMLANRDSGGAATGEEAQKASHRRRKAQIPHRVIKTTENKSRAGAMPVDSESESGDDYHATAARSSKPMDESDSRLNGHTAENSTSAHEMDEPLPEGTVILQPEAAKDNSPYVGPEFGTTKSRHQTPSIQAGDSILNRTYKCTACNQQLCSLTTATVKTHPMLSVLLCQTCFNFYESGEFDRDKNGYDEQCRWCGQGGNLICCDFCKHSFCKSCIRKNLGRDHLLQVLDADRWKCLCCNPKPLAFLMQECTLLVASITPVGGGGAGSATAHAGSASSDAVSRRPVRRAATKPTVASAVASVASTPTAAGAKTPSASGAGSSGADSRKIAGKHSGNPAVVAANSKGADSSKQSLATGGRPTPASSKSSSTATAGVASSPAAASSYSAAVAAVGRSMQVQASRRGPSATAAASSAIAPIIVPLGIVPRAAIRGSRTTFPELVHRLSESMIERIKKKLVGLQPSNDVKLLVEEVSLEELSSPMSVRRRRLYEVPWERLGFAAPPPEPLRASALTTAGLTTSGTVVASPASAPAASPVQSSATPTDAVKAAGKAPKPTAVAAARQLPPAQQPATGSGAAVGDTSTQRPSAVLGQQLSVDGMSITDIITKLKRRELTDAESTANRFLHTLEQAKVNFTELRKEVHAIKQAKIRHNQETMQAPTKRSGQQPQHFETEVALHARIRAALLDHLQVVYQICLSSTRPVGGEVPSVTPAAASAAPLLPPPPSPAPTAATEEDVTSDEYIDLIDYERMKKSGGQVASTPSLAGNAAPATGNSSKQDMHANAARSSPSTSAAGSSSVVKKGGSTVASAAAGTSKSGKGKKDNADNVASVGKHNVLVVDSDSNEDDKAAKKQSALQSPAATSAADDTDGGNSTEASSSSRAGAAKKLPQKGKPGQPASAAAHGDRTPSGGSCKPADSHSTAGRLQVDEDDDDIGPAEGKSTGKSAAASQGAAATGNSVPPMDAPHGSGERSPLGANDQAKLELLDDLYDMSDDDDVNDGDDDNDEDYALSHAKAKQRLTSSKRSQSAANRDVRIAVKRVGADGGSDSEPSGSAHKPADAAYVKLKLLNPLEIQSIRAELKLRAMSRAAKVKKQPEDSSSECGSRAEKQLRNLSRMVVNVKPEPSSNGDALQGQDEVSSTGDESPTEGESKEADTAAAAAAGGSTEVEQPKGVHKKSKKQCTADADGSASRSSLPPSEEASSDDTGSESDAVASDADGALAARSGEPAAGAGIGDDAANDSNKAALRSLLSEGLFDSSLEDVANSDSDEVQQPVKKRRRLASDEEGSAASDGDTRDNASRASGDLGGSSDAIRKATHPLLRKRLPQGVGYSDSGGEGGSPAAKGLGESEASLDDAESESSAKQNLHETSNMPRSTESQSDHSSDSDSEQPGRRASKESKGSSPTAAASDDDSDGVVGGGGGGTKKRLRLSSSSSGSNDAGAAAARSYNAPKRRRRVNPLDSTDTAESSSGAEGSEVDNALSTDEATTKADTISDSSQRRRKIRRLIEADRLRGETKAAAKAEEERRHRIREKQKLYNQFVIDLSDSAVACRPLTELVLERGEGGKAIVAVDPELVTLLKPHQAEAVQFLWDCVIESVARIKSANVTSAAGSGAILAHCMGLGKTLSVITFLHTVLNHESLLSLRTAVVLCPLGTIFNWAREWDKWQENVDRRIHLFDMSIMKRNVDRAQMLSNWRKDGGVLVLGYEMYRTLVIGKRLKDKSLKETFTSALLDPGPDIIVCDEGHLLKNASTNINKSLVKAHTQRRIVLTGTPLQNNLKEYYVMMDFVKPNLLGSSKEFSNRFIQPILNGQCKDSTPTDVKLMKKRAHVLHEMLAGCVQRRDYSALTKYLPPKLEYIVSVRLSKLQILLYERYLKLREGHIGANASAGSLFADYQSLLKVWTHPWLLHLDKRRREADEESFIDDETSEESVEEEDDDDVLVQDSSDDAADVTWKPLRKKKNEKKDGSDSVIKDLEVIDVDADVPVRPETIGLDPGWWQSMVPSDVERQFEQSGKLLLLFEILRLSEEIGDKVLVFSQSLLTLDYIEDALGMIDEAIQSPSGDAKLKTISGTGRFVKNVNYFRLDGSVNVHVRTRACEKFNDPNNLDARLFLISTRAGGLGINLSTANRVVILDASWNPSQDVQAIFRAYRFGQTKPCYVYRLLSQGSMEERIYERQVTKLSLSERVVDERQIERHFMASDLSELYKFTPDRPDDPNAKPKETPVLPKDRVLAELLEGHASWIVSYHEHDSLLENLVSEELTEEERKIAWDEYKAEKERGYAVAAAASASAVAGTSSGGGVGAGKLPLQLGSGFRSWPPRTPKEMEDVGQAIRLRLQLQGLTNEDELQRRTENILQMAIVASYSPRAEQLRQPAPPGHRVADMAQQLQHAAMLVRQASVPASVQVGMQHSKLSQWPLRPDAGQFRGGPPFSGMQPRLQTLLHPRSHATASGATAPHELPPTVQPPFRPDSVMRVSQSGAASVAALAPAFSAAGADGGLLGSRQHPLASFEHPAAGGVRLPIGQSQQMQPTTIVAMGNAGAQVQRGNSATAAAPSNSWQPYPQQPAQLPPSGSFGASVLPK